MFSNRSAIGLKLALLMLILCPTAWAKPLVQFSEGQTRVTVERQISRGKPSIAVKIKSGKVGDVDIFTLTEPNRIVADIGSIPAKRSKEFKVSETNRINGVRMGTFENKFRLVLDIEGDQIPAYSWIEGKQTLTLLVYDDPQPIVARKPPAAIVKPEVPAQPPLQASARAPKITVTTPIEQVAAVKVVKLVKRIEGPGIGAASTRPVTVASSITPPVAGSTAPPVAPQFLPPLPESAASVFAKLDAEASTAPPPVFATETARASLTPDPNRIPPPDLGFAATDQALAAEAPIQRMPPAPDRSQNVAALTRRDFVPPSGPNLQAISFDYDQSNAPIIKLRLTAPPQFNVAKTGLLEYKLTVSDCVLGSQAVGLPQFPPQDFEGFTVVVATQAADRIEILFGVERGYRLVPTANGKEIWVGVEKMRRVA